MKQYIGRLVGALLVSIAMLPALAMAAGSAVVQAGDETLDLQWQGDNSVRFQVQDQKDYFLLKEGSAYAVTYKDEQPQVIELGGVMKAIVAMNGKSSPGDFLGEVSAVTATGKVEEVAGIKGEVYQATFTDSEGKTDQRNVVLTADAKVVEMTQAFLTSVAGMVGQDDIDHFTANLPADKRGLLRAGDDFRVASLSSKVPAADAFKLPAEPLDMGKVMQGFGDKVQQMSEQFQQQMQQMGEQFQQH